MSLPTVEETPHTPGVPSYRAWPTPQSSSCPLRPPGGVGREGEGGVTSPPDGPQAGGQRPFRPVAAGCRPAWRSACLGASQLVCSRC